MHKPARRDGYRSIRTTDNKNRKRLHNFLDTSPSREFFLSHCGFSILILSPIASNRPCLILYDVLKLHELSKEGGIPYFVRPVRCSDRTFH